MENPADQSLIKKFATRSSYMMALAILLATMVIFGWQFDLEQLRRPFPNGGTMNPVSAVCFILTGITFFLTRRKSTSVYGLYAGYFLAGIVSLIGLIKLSSFSGLINLPVDSLIFTDKLPTGGPSPFMAANTAINFSLLGLALIFSLQSGKVIREAANIISALIVLIALISVLRYVYDAQDAPGMFFYIRMSLITALGFSITGLAVLFAHTQSGFMSIISSRYSGGTIARIFLPAAFLVPMTIGYVRLQVARQLAISDEMGVVLLITGIVVLFILLILFVASVINRSDSRRREAEEQLANANKDLEQKVIERTEAVAASERRLRAILENSPDAIVITDKDLLAIYQSPAAERMTGLSLEYRRAHPNERYTHPDDVPILNAKMKKLMETPETSQQFQLRMRTLKGDYIWIEGVMANLLDNKNVEGISFSYRDITDRKKLEEQRALMALVVDSSDDAIIFKSPEGMIMSWNRGAEHIFGYAAADAIGQPITITIPEDLEQEERVVLEKIGTGQSVEHRETQRVRKDGRRIDISVSISPVRDDAGKIIGASMIARDISDKKETERKIAESEHRFRAMIENISDAIVVNDENAVVMYQSPSVERILGYSQEERKGKSLLQYVHPDYLENFKKLYEDLRLSPGVPIPFQYRFLHKNGNYIWLEGVVTNLLHQPSVRAYVANYRDITERKIAEQELSRERTLLRILIDNIPDYIYVKDLQSRHIINNNAMVKLLGASSEKETLGRSSIDFFGREIAEPYLKEDKEILSSGIARINFEESTITPAGELKYLLTTKIPLRDGDGKIIGLVGISHDITQQKEVELDLQGSKYFLELAQATGHTGHWVLEIGNQRLVTWSKEALRILNLPASNLTGSIEMMYQFVHPDDVTRLKTLIETSIVTRTSFNIDHRLLLDDGSIRWVHQQGEPSIDERSAVLVSIVQDITERKKSQDEILQLNSELEQRVHTRTEQLQASNKEMEAFSYSVSHDLRAPLRIIHGFSKILSEDYRDTLDATGQKTLDAIMRNVKKMGQLIDDLLDFSRLGRAEIRTSTVDMGALVREVLEDLRISGVEIPKITIDKLELANADINLIKQVWTNLLTNAIKYSGGKPQPEIHVGMQRNNGQAVYFVRDNGAGFDMTYYHKLFGVFQRLHGVNEFPGTGVGLAIVHRIITRHGGRVWAEGKVDEGAIFFFSLP